MRRKNREFDEVQDNGNGKEVQHLRGKKFGFVVGCYAIAKML